MRFLPAAVKIGTILNLANASQRHLPENPLYKGSETL